MSFYRFVFLALLAGVLLPITTSGQAALPASPSVAAVLTYQARNYFPADYAGKAPATPGSEVAVSALFIQANRIVALPDAIFTWYVDEKLQTRGAESEFSFVASAIPPGEHFVRLVAARGNEVVEVSLAVPVVAPRVVIDAPYPAGRLVAGSETGFRALPYFFAAGSLEDLAFFWDVNGRERRAAGSDNQLVVRLGTPAFESDRAFTLSATIQNRRNTLQIARQQQTFFVATP